MMKQAILIQCHNHPEIVNAIIEYFPQDVFDFYIHIDKKSDMNIVEKDNVFLVKGRIDVRWGQFSQVEATYALINMISLPSNYSYCHFISGVDFPIKTVDWFIDKYEHNDKEYIHSNLLDKTCTWSWGGKDRFCCWYPQWMIQKPQAHKIIRIIRVVYREFIMRTKFLMRKDQPVEYFYGGSSWWSLTGECIDWIKNNTTKEYYDFFKHGVCVDEIYFSTLLRYSPYNNRIVSKPVRFMRWDEPGVNTGGPANIELADIPEMINSDLPFARKIDDIQLVNKLILELCKYNK